MFWILITFLITAAPARGSALLPCLKVTQGKRRGRGLRGERLRLPLPGCGVARSAAISPVPYLRCEQVAINKDSDFFSFFFASEFNYSGICLIACYCK